jgi:hypothetical protein
LLLGAVAALIVVVAVVAVVALRSGGDGGGGAGGGGGGGGGAVNLADLSSRCSVASASTVSSLVGYQVDAPRNDEGSPMVAGSKAVGCVYFDPANQHGSVRIDFASGVTKKDFDDPSRLEGANISGIGDAARTELLPSTGASYVTVLLGSTAFEIFADAPQGKVEELARQVVAALRHGVTPA